jgi:hypothetical protein
MALPIDIPANTVKTFSEDTRVKIPALLHLTRLGYTYLSLKNATWDEATNIFPELFHSSIAAINPDATADDIDRLLQEISLLLEKLDFRKFLQLSNAANARLALLLQRDALEHGHENTLLLNTALKTETDARISQNAQLLTNPAYAEKMMDRLIIEQLKNNHQLPLTAEGSRFINNLIIKEYLTESQGQQPA